MSQPLSSVGTGQLWNLVTVLCNVLPRVKYRHPRRSVGPAGGEELCPMPLHFLAEIAPVFLRKALRTWRPSPSPVWGWRPLAALARPGRTQQGFLTVSVCLQRRPRVSRAPCPVYEGLCCTSSPTAVFSGGCYHLLLLRRVVLIHTGLGAVYFLVWVHIDTHFCNFKYFLPQEGSLHTARFNILHSRG